MRRLDEKFLRNLVRKAIRRYFPEECGKKYQYDFPMASMTTDAVVFSRVNGRICVLLILRKGEPFAGSWALPGGFVEIAKGEEVATSALRELQEETGVNLSMSDIHKLSERNAPNRDPRGRVVSTPYWAYVENVKPIAGDDARKAEWFPINQLPQLAFDHEEIIKEAIGQLMPYLKRQQYGGGREELNRQTNPMLRKTSQIGKW